MDHLRARFWKTSIPFVAVYAVVWGVGNITLPLLAGSDARAGLVFAMLNLGVGLAAPVWGLLANRVRLSFLVLWSAVLSGSSWLALTLLGSRLLPALCLLFGLASAGIFALATVQVTHIFPKDKWDEYIARMQSLMTAGQVTGLLATSLYAKAVVGLPFLVVGILVSAFVSRGAIAAVVHRHHHFHVGRLAPRTNLPGIVHGHYHLRFRLRHLGHLANLPLLLVLSRWTLVLLAYAPIYAVYPLMMKGAFGFDSSVASIVYSVSTALTVLFFVVAGRVAKRRAPFAVTTLGAAISTLSFLCMIAGPYTGIGSFGAVGFLLMVSSYAFVAVGMNDGVVTLVSEQKEGEALGVANALMSADNVLGGLGGGVLVTVFGYESIFLLGLVLSGAAVGLGMLRPRTRPVQTGR